jgi:chromosome segregation and condensation protein ScpB
MGRVEAVIFASPTPVPRETLAALVGPECRLDELIADIQDELRARPYELVFVAGGWQHRTRPRYADAIRAPGRVNKDASAPALTATENLVVTAIAYLQPVTRAELSRLLGRRSAETPSPA